MQVGTKPKYKRYIIHSKSWGVFLGTALGFGFWSQLDAAGQTAAVAFDSEQDCKNFISCWDCEAPDDVEYLEVETEDPTWASIEECMLAGAAGWGDAVVLH